MKRILSLLIACLLLLPGLTAWAEATTTNVENELTILRMFDWDESDYALEKYVLRGTEEAPAKGRYAAALEAFSLLHPGVTVRNDALGHAGPQDDLYDRLSAGAPEIDIIYLNGADLHALAERGLVADLAQSTALTDALSAYPDMTALLGDAGRLYAVPERLTSELFRVNNRVLLEEVGGVIDDTVWTWEDFFALGDALHARNLRTGSDDKLICSRTWNPTWLDQFVINESGKTSAEIDEEVLGALLVGWKRMADHGLVIDPFTYQEQNAAHGTLFANLFIDFTDLTVYPALRPPTYREGIRRTGINVPVYIVNPASDIQAEAMAFLACYSAPEAVTMSPAFRENGIFPADTSPYAQPMPQIEALWTETIETGYNNSLCAQQRDAAYQACRAFLEEEINLEECVQQIVSAIAMPPAV